MNASYSGAEESSVTLRSPSSSSSAVARRQVQRRGSTKSVTDRISVFGSIGSYLLTYFIGQDSIANWTDSLSSLPPDNRADAGAFGSNMILSSVDAGASDARWIRAMHWPNA